MVLHGARWCSMVLDGARVGMSSYVQSVKKSNTWLYVDCFSRASASKFLIRVERFRDRSHCEYLGWVRLVWVGLG